MKPTEFLERKLNKIFVQFTDIKIRYEYRANTCSHLIEVTPLAFFKENEKYILLEDELEEEFETLYPNENIVFISEDSLTEIRTPNFELGFNNDIVFDLDLMPGCVTDIFAHKNKMFNIEYFEDEVSEVDDCEFVNSYALAA